jgi:hypothetical protein
MSVAGRRYSGQPSGAVGGFVELSLAMLRFAQPARCEAADDVDSPRYDLKLWITHSSKGATYLPR